MTYTIEYPATGTRVIRGWNLRNVRENSSGRIVGYVAYRIDSGRRIGYDAANRGRPFNIDKILYAIQRLNKQHGLPEKASL